MTNEKAKGQQFSVCGSKPIFYEDFLNLIAKQMGIELYSKFELGKIKELCARLFIGRTHDSRIMEMFRYIEENPNIIELGPSYHATYKLKFEKNVIDEPKYGMSDYEDILYPSHMQYKHFALD